MNYERHCRRIIKLGNWIGEEKKHIRKDDIEEFARGKVDYKVGESGYTADVIVAIRKNGAAVLYDLINVGNISNCFKNVSGSA